MSSESNVKKFNGKIIRRESETIYVNIYPGRECSSIDIYSIVFEINRMGFQLQHNALNFIKQHALFGIFINNPLYHAQNVISPSTNIQNISSSISNSNELNDEQFQAIENIVNGNYSPVPFLLYGPPGMNFSKFSMQFRKMMQLKKSKNNFIW